MFPSFLLVLYREPQKPRERESGPVISSRTNGDDSEGARGAQSNKSNISGFSVIYNYFGAQIVNIEFYTGGG